MRLLSLTVRNYRVHRERSIEFDPARNLLGGPNESGKSTLVEAAHRVLFLRAKTGGNLQAEMVSSLHHGVPEVVLSFEASGERWEIEKRFAGAKGTARLTGPGGVVFKDDEAETKLGELLKTEVAGGRSAAGQLPSLWGHLWVWQGSSGDDPGRHAVPFKDSLARRLQRDGIGAAMQSATDQQVCERIAASYDTLFTPTGKPRAGSSPERAREEWEGAVRAHQVAVDAVARLEAAIADHANAERQLREADAVLPGLRVEKTKVDEQLTRVTELRREEESYLRAWEGADAVLKQLLAHDSKIQEFAGQLVKSREAILPAEEQEARLVTAEQLARAASEEAAKNFQQAAEALSRARLQHNLAVTFVAAFEKSEAHRVLSDRLKDVAAIGKERMELLESLAKLPPVAAKEVQLLRKLDRDASQAGASLNAMAAGIEIIRSEVAVTLDGETMRPGESRVLTDSGELVIGEGTAIRIRPGGGTSLAEARDLAERTRRALADELGRHGLTDLDHATEQLERRQALEQQVVQLDTRWKAMGGETLVAEVTAAELARNAAKAEVERRREALDKDQVAPESLPAAISCQVSAAEALRVAEGEEGTCRRLDGELRARLATAAGALQAHREQLAASRQVLRDLETRVHVLEDSHGDAARRDATLIELRETERKAGLEVAAVRKKLADLSSDQLAADRQRFERAIALQETRRREAEDLRLAARTRLHLDGSTDPHADLSHAKARLEAKRAAHDAEQRRAQAIARLHGLFTASREAIDRNLVQPLADRIAGYLQCLYGPGAAVQVVLSDEGIAGLELLRPGAPAFSFATLSGGAREQVAAAVRLAMAEILAADHDGCLPLVFDDAFAYSDTGRIQALQRMLDVAAIRGLQVLVLTCTPVDYSGFGASEHHLTA